jgi:hypothetical protein
MPEAGWDHLMVKESTKCKVVGSGEHDGVSGSTENAKVNNMLREYGLLDGVKNLHKDIDQKINTYYDEESSAVNPQALQELNWIKEALEGIMDKANLEHEYQDSYQ